MPDAIAAVFVGITMGAAGVSRVAGTLVRAYYDGGGSEWVKERVQYEVNRKRVR